MHDAVLRAFAVLLALAFAAPAHAQLHEDAYAGARAIVGDLGRVTAPNGIEELVQVDLNGVPQWVSIRGADRNNPVLLYVHGGPGRPMMPAAWTFQRAWEDYFTVVQWDQRGAGKTHRSTQSQAVNATISFDQITADAVALMAYLRENLGVQRIFILGHSWGGAVALSAALRQPDWVHAYIALSPLLNMVENERESYRLVLAEAYRRGDVEAIAQLESLAPYPGDELTLERNSVERSWVVRYGGLSANRPDADQFFRATRLAPEYDAADVAATNDGSLMSAGGLLPWLPQLDLTTTTRRVSFPVIAMVGRHDLTTPPGPTVAWVERLRAPAKHVIWFENSAHLAPLEEPGRMLIALVDIVRPYSERRRR